MSGPGRTASPRGREMRAGEVVLRRGERLNPAALGLLASVGRTEVVVVPRPRVVVVPTGDELVEPDRVPGPGQIRNSNAVDAPGAGLDGRGRRRGPADRARRARGSCAEILGRGLDADVLLITGGVSAGKRDLVPETLERLGVARVFHKVRLKPGKPLWFGVGPPRSDGPGASRLRPARQPGQRHRRLPALRPARASTPSPRGRAAGPPIAAHRLLAGPSPTSATARPITRRGWSRPATATALEPLDWAGSADLRTVAGADGFAIFPAGDRAYDAGEIVDFLPLG